MQTMARVAGALDADALDIILREARTHSAWSTKPVPDETLRELYDLVKMGPTSSNGNPMRLVFVRTPEGKERLRPALFAGNVDKAMAAPVTAVVGFDPGFFTHLPRLSPHAQDVARIFADNPSIAERAALRNSALQGAYLIIAARALGLDCGPMSGFDHTRLDQAFFGDSGHKSNFLVNLGYGDRSRLRPRGPRFEFDEVCSFT